MGNQFHSHHDTVVSTYNLDHFLIAPKPISQDTVTRTQLFAKPVQQYIQKNQPFKDKVSSFKTFAALNEDLYQGPIDSHGQPSGFGRVIRSDDSVVYADFSHGKAEGDGCCIYKDGSVYKGNFKNGQAEGQGFYENNSIRYQGAFSNNIFNGKGKLQAKGDTKYEAVGIFENGVQKQGALRWEEKDESNKSFECSYEGEFNKQGNFNGKGTLINRFGKYVGAFQNGLKHGQGKFYFSNGLLYVGTYVKDIRQGQGIIYNASKVEGQKYAEKDSLVAYRGEFSNNNPHGEGEVFDPTTNQLIKATFIEGVNQKSAIYESGSKIKSQIAEKK